ncbi:hypothetical protein [Streptomyces sp. NPDC093568]|uniref:hypothetical protein n=1 Tax=Streptomyces sp. NPDC093568 TaxID=3366041 RepID=UPI003821EF12
MAPESTETASLYYSDEEYEALARLLGGQGEGTRDKPPEAELMAARQINVTWMVHDVSPWRLDQVYAAHKRQAVWIHTAMNLDATTNGAWHRADHPSQLRALFAELGLMGKASSDGGAAISPPDASDAGDRVTGASPAASGSREGTDWWWALPGAAAGAVLALVLRPFATRLPLDRLRGEPGPRQELRDV